MRRLLWRGPHPYGNRAPMKTIIWFLVLACATLAAGASVQESTQPPISYSADQPEITIQSMDYEAAQFKAVADWRLALDQAELWKIKHEFAAKEHERAKTLLAKEQISRERYWLYYYRAEAARLEQERQKSDARQHHATAVAYQLGVESYGNPQKDYRVKMIDARLDMLHAQCNSLGLALQIVELENKLAAAKRDHGTDLLSKGTIAQAHFDDRELAAQASAQQAVILRNQKAAAEAHILALEKTRARLVR